MEQKKNEIGKRDGEKSCFLPKSISELEDIFQFSIFLKNFLITTHKEYMQEETRQKQVSLDKSKGKQVNKFVLTKTKSDNGDKI